MEEKELSFKICEQLTSSLRIVSYVILDYIQQNVREERGLPLQRPVDRLLNPENPFQIASLLNFHRTKPLFKNTNTTVDKMK